jgi:hypothetical protein
MGGGREATAHPCAAGIAFSLDLATTCAPAAWQSSSAIPVLDGGAGRGVPEITTVLPIADEAAVLEADGSDALGCEPERLVAVVALQRLYNRETSISKRENLRHELGACRVRRGEETQMALGDSDRGNHSRLGCGDHPGGRRLRCSCSTLSGCPGRYFPPRVAGRDLCKQS